MADESIIVDLKQQGVKDLIDNLGLASKGFTELDKAITEANKELATLDKNSQEFKNLTKEINAATTAANAYAQSTDTLKKELRDTTNEIGNLERSIKALEKTNQTSSQTYTDLVKKQDDLKKKAGELKDTIGDLNEEIKNSGSDTKNLDKALRAIGAVAAGYQVAQGALALFGSENKKFEQALLKLNAVMAITNGLQQIQSELSKKDSIFTTALAKAKQFYTVQLAAATTATKIFYGVLTGGFLAALFLALTYWEDIAKAIGINVDNSKELADIQERLKKIEEDRKELNDAELRYLKAKGVSQDEIIKKEIAIAIEEEKRLEGLIKISKFRFVDNNDPQAFEKRKQAQKEAIEVDKQFEAQLLNSKARVLELQNSLEKLNKPDKEKKEKVKELKDEVEQLSKQRKLIRDAEARHQKQLDDLRLQANERRKSQARTEGLERIEEAERLANELEQQNREIDERELKAQKEKHDLMLEAERKQAERVAFILQTLSSLANDIGNIAQQAISIRADNELKLLEDKRKQGLISEKRFEQESAKIKEDAARKQRAADIAIAVAKIPLIFLQALVSAPFPFGLILASIASGIALAQVAILAASPLPKFKHGGQVSEKLGLIKGKRHEQGGVPIEVEGDEYVMPVKETRENLDALKAIHKGKFKELYVPKSQLIQPDIFANIPNPANIDSSVFMDKDDYSSINSRLDKVASELWWLTNETKKGNKLREKGTDKVVKAFQTKSKRYV